MDDGREWEDSELIYLEPGNPYCVVGHVTRKELRQMELDRQLAELMWKQFYEQGTNLPNGMTLH